MPNPLNKTSQSFFPGGKNSRGPSRSKGQRATKELEAEPPLKQSQASKQPPPPTPEKVPGKVPPGGTKEIARLLHALVGVKKSREKGAGNTSAKK